jgi:PAS domain S-box-containing protein
MPVSDRVATLTVRLIIVFASIFVAGVVAFTLPSLGGRLSLPLLPSGIAVAAAYRWGRRMWPAVFAAAMAIELWLHHTFPEAIGVGAGLAGGAWLTAWLMDRGGFDSNFSRAKDVPLFIVSAVIGMTLAPTFGMAGLIFGGDNSFATATNRDLWIEWTGWWSNTTTGVLLLAPILLAYSRNSLARVREHWGEGALWLIGVVICCGWILLARQPNVRPLIVVLANILVVVSAIRFGLVVAALGAFAILTMTAISAEFAIGAFALLDKTLSFITIWSFIAALSGFSLIITALLAERDSAALEKLRAEHRYEQVFDGGPQPLWVHARDTLKFLLVNDAAVRQYGWSREELLMRTVDVLAAPEKQAVLPPLPQDAGVSAELAAEPFETQHITKDGRVLEIEVWTRSIDCGGQPAELAFAADVTERRAFGQALMDAIGGEQRRIAEEMHDGLGQELTGLALSVRALANRAQKERDVISVELDQLALLATSCIQDAHRIVQGLSPLTNAEGNLEAALEGLAKRSSLSGIRVRFRGRHDLPPLDLKARNHLYRIAQEAVQNALKHSAAKSIEIELSAHPGTVTLTVADDGQGLTADADAGTGLGMRTMRFRASAIGGKLAIRRGVSGGNAVVCSVPTKASYAAAG